MATGFLAKIWSFLSSPFGHIFTSILEKGGDKIGQKIGEKMEKMFEIGEKSLGDEILCDNAIADMDESICSKFEDFMGWLQKQPTDGKQKAEKIREIIVKKITSKEIKTGGGKSGKPIETEIVYDYTQSQGFIKRMMSHGDQDAILEWLDKKNLFSTIALDKKSAAEKIAGKVGNKVKVEARDLKSMLDEATQWLNDNKKQ